jgi:hypothetical protein
MSALIPPHDDAVTAVFQQESAALGVRVLAPAPADVPSPAIEAMARAAAPVQKRRAVALRIRVRPHFCPFRDVVATTARRHLSTRGKVRNEHFVAATPGLPKTQHTMKFDDEEI